MSNRLITGRLTESSCRVVAECRQVWQYLLSKLQISYSELSYGPMIVDPSDVQRRRAHHINNGPRDQNAKSLSGCIMRW
jgi:Glu-tRNA(Gln) amidotransferase subunit E-like FAD-binding protein